MLHCHATQVAQPTGSLHDARSMALQLLASENQKGSR
jgi:hypothetical protein